MFARGSAQKNFKVQPKSLQSQCFSCQASVSHLVSRMEQFHAGQPPAAPEGWCCCQRGQRIPLFWRGTCADLQPLPAGTGSSLLVLCVLLLWLLGRATGAVAGGTLLSLFLELSFQIIPKSLLCCLQSHCVFLAKRALGNDAGAWKIWSWCQ